jgi:hypothetical protein
MPWAHPLIEVPKGMLDASRDDKGFCQSGFVNGTMSKIGAYRRCERLLEIFDEREQPPQSIPADRRRDLNFAAGG